MRNEQEMSKVNSNLVNSTHLSQVLSYNICFWVNSQRAEIFKTLCFLRKDPQNCDIFYPDPRDLIGLTLILFLS